MKNSSFNGCDAFNILIRAAEEKLGKLSEPATPLLSVERHISQPLFLSLSKVLISARGHYPVPSYFCLRYPNLSFGMSVLNVNAAQPVSILFWKLWHYLRHLSALLIKNRMEYSSIFFMKIRHRSYWPHFQYHIQKCFN